MAFSYNLPPTTDLDWVRLLSGDTKTPGYLQDEEVQALIDSEQSAAAISGDALRYYAAARCLETLEARWVGLGLSIGLIAKHTADLDVQFGSQAGAIAALKEKIESLRSRGSWLLRRSSRYGGSRIMRTF